MGGRKQKGKENGVGGETRPDSNNSFSSISHFWKTASDGKGKGVGWSGGMGVREKFN